MSVCTGPAVSECRFHLNEKSEISRRAMTVCNMCRTTKATSYSSFFSYQFPCLCWLRFNGGKLVTLDGAIMPITHYGDSTTGALNVLIHYDH